MCTMVRVLYCCMCMYITVLRAATTATSYVYVIVQGLYKRENSVEFHLRELFVSCNEDILVKPLSLVQSEYPSVQFGSYTDASITYVLYIYNAYMIVYICTFTVHIYMYNINYVTFCAVNIPLKPQVCFGMLMFVNVLHYVWYMYIQAQLPHCCSLEGCAYYI